MSAPCRFFQSPQGCRFGTGCHFSHSGGSAVGNESKYNNSAPSCRFYSSSRGCRFGTNCHFKHDNPPPKAVQTEPEVVKPPENPPTADTDDELIVFGFLRDLAKGVVVATDESEDSGIPEGLHKLCQSFYSLIIKWDESSKWHSSNMQVVDSGHSIKMNKTCWGSAFLTEQYSEGVHHWRFKLQSLDCRRRYYVLFGIWKADSGPPILDSFFTDKKENGYAMNVIDGTLTVPHMPGCGGVKYATYCKTGDIIDMYLDFEALMLTFAINGKYYEKGQKVEGTAYKAAVTMYWEQDTIRLVSHDNKPFAR